MNIKRLTHRQAVRHAILRAFSWVPDKFMLPLQYYIVLHRWPDFIRGADMCNIRPTNLILN